MRVKELEKMFGVTRANIRFYEKEGLLNPERAENGYRDYDNEDVERIKKIILFRKLGISIPEIKKILNKENTLSDIVSDNLKSLKEQIEQLQGAVDICNEMLRDDTLDSDFSVDTYWNLVEKKESAGEKFFDYLKDYVKQEGERYVWMFGGVFLHNAKESLHETGWKIMISGALGMCVANGFARSYLWHEGSFLSGFLAPLCVFMIFMLATFPLYVLDKMYGITEAEAKKLKVPKKSLAIRMIIALAKTLGLLAYFVMMLIGLPVLSDIWIDKMIGVPNNFMVSYSIFGVYYFVGVLLIFVLIWLYGNTNVFGDSSMNYKGYKAHLPGKIRRRILVISFLVLFAVFGVCDTWYDCVSENGISVRRVFLTKEYTFDEAEYFEVYVVKTDGTLGYRIKMQDGTFVEVLGGHVLTYDFDEKRFPGEESDFILYLTEEFVNKGIPVKVESWEKIEENLDYEYWENVLKEIKTIVEK